MARILRLPVQTPAKFGFERARKRKKPDPEAYGQLNLFSQPEPPPARILSLPSRLTPFEEALLWDERDHPRAVELYWKAIDAGDCTADAYCNLGILESRTRHTARAFDCFARALKEDPRHFEAHYNLANLYLDAGDLRMARLHYEIAAEIDPTFPNLYFNLGLAMALDEDYTAAIEMLAKYQELVPEEEGNKADDLLRVLRNSVGG